MNVFLLSTTIALVRPTLRTQIRPSRSRPVLASTPTVPLFDFQGANRDATIERWERIDDVIMGGVSRSRLVAADSGTSFEGRLRSEGGGFCGTRLKLLAEPLDLSAASGLYIDCAADSDADARVHKVSVRTAQDRGEQVYQSVFVPPAGGPRSTLRVPFDDFRLVRGARLVPDAPPLGPSLNATYQVSLTVSKFGIAETMSPLEGFKEGPFSLRLYEIGAYSEGGAAPAAALPPVLEDADKKVPSSAPAAIRALRFVLGPALALVFGEARRRRRAAALLLEKRGLGPIARARFGWAHRRGRANAAVAAARAAKLAALDATAVAIALPIRALFFVLFKAIALARKLKGGKA